MAEPGFFDAYDQAWVPLTNAVALLDVLVRLEPTDVLQRLRSGASPQVVGDLADLDAATTSAMLRVLELAGVVEQHSDAFVLTAPWLALTDPGAFVPLGTMIAGQAANSTVLRNLGRLAYWEQTSEDRLAMARAVSPDPYSDDLVAAYRGALASDPVGQKILEGGRFLELGCGVAGRILLTLRAAPELTAVGIELTEDLAAEAARRAEELGLADRFTVVCMDAGDYVADEPFDSGFWSQFFFPDHARPRALAVMLASLRPGSAFQAPVGADPDATQASPTAALDEAVMQTMLRSWAVPERTVEGLVAEFAAAGFVDVEVIAREGGPAVRGWKP